MGKDVDVTLWEKSQDFNNDSSLRDVFDFVAVNQSLHSEFDDFVLGFTSCYSSHSFRLATFPSVFHIALKKTHTWMGVKTSVVIKVWLR